jgi:hypothetical protein|tara:strand:- start:745 stop:915 length:171 start_codon:yes stop_codon:yes gene_type:complete
MYEILNIVLLIISGWVAWESSVMISEKKARYRAGTHDYYDNPICKVKKKELPFESE